MPVIPGPIELWIEFDLGHRSVVPIEFLDDKSHSRPVSAEKREVEPVVGAGHPERQRTTARRTESSGNGCGGFHKSATTMGVYAVSEPDGAFRSFTRRMASSASHRTGLSSYAAACW